LKTEQQNVNEICGQHFGAQSKKRFLPPTPVGIENKLELNRSL
jgi:hypothetical protein